MNVRRRAQLMVEIEEAGRRRREASETAQAELAAIAEPAREAIAEGIPLAEVARIAGVSRPTLYKLISSPSGRRTRAKASR